MDEATKSEPFEPVERARRFDAINRIFNSLAERYGFGNQPWLVPTGVLEGLADLLEHDESTPTVTRN